MNHPPRTSTSSVSTAAVAVFAIVWIATVALPPAAFLRWRHARLAELAVPAVQEDWDRFRADMRAQSDGSGPVRRKVPKSAEPPEKIWLRDYPVAVVAAWVTFAGLLGAVYGMLLLGALHRPSRGPTRFNDPG